VLYKTGCFFPPDYSNVKQLNAATMQALSNAQSSNIALPLGKSILLGEEEDDVDQIGLP